MTYAIQVDEPTIDAVHRISGEQVERAVASLEEADSQSLATAVHDSRKRAKKLRGLIRLVRPALGKAYGAANGSFRDAGRELSGLRDAQAALAAFDTMVAAAPDRLPAGGLGAVRSGLAALADEATRAEDRRLRIETAADLLRAGGRHVRRASFTVDGWAAVGPGMTRTYAAGRRALAEARRESEPPAVHEWRKRAKDAWYHVRLLGDAAPSILEPLRDRFHDLSDALGDAHDLVVIGERLRASPDRFGGRTQVRAAGGLADAERRKLERRAMRLGLRLYAEKPKAHANRMGTYWRAWHESGDEKPTGGLADLFPPSDDLDATDMDQLRDRAGEAALPAHLYPTKADLIGELRAAGAS
jgi:CHAD domain-containing protein